MSEVHANNGDGFACRLEQLEHENAELRSTLAARDAFIRQTMGSYVTAEVANEIIAHGGEPRIDGERRVVTMLFSDIRNSTRLSDQMDAADYLRLLSHYFEDMIMIADSWGGNILELEGDAILAVFGAPRHNEAAALHALYCAVAMQRRMPKVNAWNEIQGYPTFGMGIGVHTGEVIAGTIGSEARMKYDVIGRNVNLAARITGFAQAGQVLASTAALEAAGKGVVERIEGTHWVEPRGFTEQVLVHDIVGVGGMRI